jgi:tyrosine-protein phosphatase SIW14
MGQISFCSLMLAIPLLFAGTVCHGEEPLRKSGSSSIHSSRSFGQRRKVAGISNFGEVTPMLYRGGQPNYKGFQALKKAGVQIVVDTRGNRTRSEGKRVRMLGMKYVAIPWHCPFPHDEAFARFLKLLRENRGKKVFVHCRLGDDRTGMMIAAYRMADEGWTADEAMREMQKFGFSEAHHFICPSLASYEQSFPKRLRSSPAFKHVR